MNAYCTTCGTPRAEADKFCPHCEAGFEVDELRPARAVEVPLGHDTGWFIRATAVLAVCVISGILGANALITDALAAIDSPSTSDFIGPDGRVTSGSSDPLPAPEETTTETWTPSPTEYETIETPTVPIETPSPTPGNELVAVAPEVAQDSTAPAVVDLLTAYFRAINTQNYEAYQAQHTPAAQAKLTSKQFTKGFRSTVNSDVTLLGLPTAADGRQLAEISFTSKQHAVDGPDRQTCTRWTVTKFLEGQSPSLLIGKAPTSYKARYEAC